MEPLRNKHRGPKRKAVLHPNLPRGRSDGFARQFPRVPPSLAGQKRVFVTCHYCGYSPSQVPPGGVCPKCTGHSWERFALPKRILEKHRTRRSR